MVDAILASAFDGIKSICYAVQSEFRSYIEERGYLIHEMTSLQAFLRDVQGNPDIRMKHLVRSVTDTIYRIEDVIADLTVVRSFPGGGGRAIAAEIEEIKRKIDYLSRIRDLLDLNREENQVAEWSSRETFGHQIVEHFVGRADEMDLLRSYISHGSQCRIVTIYGMGGLGKTALAKKLYQHLRDEEHFDAFAWVHASHKFDCRKVMEDLYKQLHPDHDEYLPVIEVAELVRRVREIQKSRRCLVFLDDIWTVEDWRSIRDAFPYEETPSKLIITTRIKEVMRDVAHTAGDGCTTCEHKLRYFTEDEGLQLFREMVYLRDVPDLEANKISVEIAKETVKLCEGLPLAIISFLQFMATKHTLEEWMIVQRSLESFVRKSQEFSGTFQLLSLSYDKLPQHLKSCFLYLGLFQEHSLIEAEKLYRFWEAEGLIDCGSGETVNRVAEMYLGELADRSIVEVHEEEVPIITRFKSCQLNKLMRDLCLLKNKEQYFFKIVNFEPQVVSNSFSPLSGNETYRLAINLDKYEDGYDLPLEDKEKEHIRCLLFSAKENQQGLVWPKKLSNLALFIYLRILDFNGFDFQVTKLPRGIGKLVHLKYLSFRGCTLPELPSSISNLAYLLILDLHVRPLSKINIPNVLWKLKKLKHIYFPLSFSTRGGGKLRLEGLVQLETLTNFNPGMMNIEDLDQLSKLKKLSLNIAGSVKDIEGITKRMNMVTDRHKLQTSLEISNFDCYTEERHSVLRSLLASQSLVIFSIEGHVRRLPVFNKISQNLAKIVLIGSELIEDPMRTLEKLCNLRVLVLNDDAFIDEEMICSEAGFVKLKRLELLNVQKLKKWVVKEGAMPNLSALKIENCGKLIMAIEELQFVGHLQQMRVLRVHEEFKANLREVNEMMKEDTRKVQNARPIISIDDVDLEH